MDLGTLTGFGGGYGADQGLGPQALARRRAAGAGGGQDQGGYEDPTGFYFQALLKQLNSPGYIPGGTTHLQMDFSKGVDKNHPYDVAYNAPQKTFGQPAGPRPDANPEWNQNWATRSNYSKLYAKYGPTLGVNPGGYVAGKTEFTPTGEAAGAPDFSRLIDLSNQAFGGSAGDFQNFLSAAGKDINAAQGLSGTFESQAGAAANSAAMAGLQVKLQALLAPRLVNAAQQLQGFNYELTRNGNPLPGQVGMLPNGQMGFGGFAIAPDKNRTTVLQYQQVQGKVPQLNTGGVYAR